MKNIFYKVLWCSKHLYKKTKTFKTLIQNSQADFRRSITWRKTT